jgi:hypothetical protein
MAGEGKYRREGVSPPLKFYPPLEQRIMLETEIKLFERGIKGVSIVNQPYANRTVSFESSSIKW